MTNFADQSLTTPSRYAKSDVRYWQARVFQRVRNRNGAPQRAKHFSVQLTAGSRREEFNLGTANKAVAAAKAREIHEHLRVNGWEATLALYKNATAREPVKRGARTIGDFIRGIEETSSRSRTTVEYTRRFRQIVGEIFGIDAGDSKYDYRAGGREDRLKKIDAIPLEDLTPASIQGWRVARLNRAPKDPASQRAVRISTNATLVQARSLFSPRRLGYIQLPEGYQSPFDGVKLERRQSTRYRGTFNAEELIKTAKRDLATADPQAYKIFLLALFCGARRGEIDKLEWTAFDWANQKLHIEVTQHLALKSGDSAGAVDLDSELVVVFKEFHAQSSGTFVIESVRSSHVGKTFLSYRCNHIFKRLADWLKTQGVRDAKPLHTLRKEYGSLICAAGGIYAASRALRHSDISVTAAHYVEPRAKATTGLGCHL